MKHMPIFVMIFVLAAFTGFTVTGCKDSGKKEDVPNEITAGNKGKVNTKLEVLKAETTATITGTVKYKGTPPVMEDDDRIGKSSDKAACLAGGGIHVKRQTWLVSADGAVRNVLVFLTPPKGKKFAPLPADKNPHASKFICDQPYCNFVPHVFGVQADITPIVFKNDATVPHNVKIDINPTYGDSINKTLAPKEESSEYKFKGKGAMMLDITCSSHSWMSAKMGIFDHPYFAVTDEKGNFEIKNAPAGVELVLSYWHESFGGLNDKKGLDAKSYSKGENKVEISLP